MPCPQPRPTIERTVLAGRATAPVRRSVDAPAPTVTSRQRREAAAVARTIGARTRLAHAQAGFRALYGTFTRVSPRLAAATFASARIMSILRVCLRRPRAWALRHERRRSGTAPGR